MRIDEIDSEHSKFKEVILDHELTEEQLDEILPIIGALAGVGATAARIGAGVVGGLARGAGALARGVGAAARGVGKTIKKTSRSMAPVPKTGPGSGTNNNSTVGKVSKAIGNLGTDLASRERGTAIKKSNKQQSLKTNTAQKLSQQGDGSGTIGTQSTQGTQGTQQTKLQRGQEFEMPITDPNSPNKTVNAKMKVKNVTGSEIELQPSKKQKGMPKTVKYNKKDLALN